MSFTNPLMNDIVLKEINDINIKLAKLFEKVDNIEKILTKKTDEVIPETSVNTKEEVESTENTDKEDGWIRVSDIHKKKKGYRIL
jgi:hypothetical protein